MKRLVIGILFGGACLYWFAHTINWSEMILVFRQIRVSWVVLCHSVAGRVCYSLPPLENYFTVLDHASIPTRFI